MARQDSYPGKQINQIFASSCDPFIKEMKCRISHIKKELSGGTGATLILGAGVSQSMDLPSWNTLLARATFLLSNMPIQKMYEIYGDSCARDTKRPKFPGAVLNVFEGTDVLEIAAYLNLVDPDQNLEALSYPVLRTSDCLLAERYKGLIRHCLFPGSDFPVDSYLNRHLALGSNTLIETAKLAARCFSSYGRSISPDYTTVRNNRSVITYNFDNLLEKVLENNIFCNEFPRATKNMKAVPLYDQQEPEPIPDDKKCLHIYHPHGYLDLCDPNGAESKSIVLSEESFYELERKNYNWVNFLLARALHDDLCLFIGFSGNDYNFRRIIKNIDDFDDEHSMEVKKFQRFLIVTIDELVAQVLKMYHLQEKAENALLLDRDISLIDDNIRRRILNYLRLKEFYWRKKGFLPIWATISDVPFIIASLH